MKDITMSMNTYRECARNLWNVYFPVIKSTGNEWDVQDEFENICSLLFSALVLNTNHISEKKSRSYEQFPMPISCLKVVPASKSGVPIEINRELKSTGYWDYPLDIISPEEADMRFIDYFDFNKLSFRDFKYCRVRIVASSKYPDIIGRDALIESNDTTILLIEK